MYVARKLAQDGTLLSVKSEGGDPAFCQQMLAATSRMSKFLNRLRRQFMKRSKMRHWTSNQALFPRVSGEKNIGRSWGFGSFVYLSLLTFC